MGSVDKSDDAEYVNSVMSSQPITPRMEEQNAPAPGTVTETRKRHLSPDSEDELPSKRGPAAQASKDRDDKDIFELMSAGFADLKSNLSSTLDSKFTDFESRMKTAIMDAVKVEIDSVRKEFNDRIDGLSKKLEDKLLTCMQNKVQQMKTDIATDLKVEHKQLQDNVTKLQKSYAEAAASTSAVISDQSKYSLVIRNLKYDQNESTDNNITKNKVNCLIRDGLKLTDVEISTAERKQTRDGRPGIIIATVATADQKTAVMQRKKDLRKIKTYESVYLEDERSPGQRLNESNMRTLLKACGKSGDYVFSNGRLFQKRRQQQ